MNLPYIVDGSVPAPAPIEDFTRVPSILSSTCSSCPAACKIALTCCSLQRVITQSNSCLLYLGRKFGLAGSTEDERIRVEQATFQVRRMRIP